jgi:hypothetical protein
MSFNNFYHINVYINYKYEKLWNIVTVLMSYWLMYIC